MGKSSQYIMISLALFLVGACETKDEQGAPPGGGSSTPQGTVSSCDLSSDAGFCLDFDATAPEGTAKGNCRGAKETLDYQGTLKESASCPTADRVGSCVAMLTGVETTYRYYAPKWDAARAKENCVGLAQGTGVFTGD